VGLFGRARERVKKGLALGKDRLELEEDELRQIRETAAMEEAVAVGLSAFAVQVASIPSKGHPLQFS
jgi:hypothetical protein